MEHVVWYNYACVDTAFATIMHYLLCDRPLSLYYLSSCCTCTVTPPFHYHSWRLQNIDPDMIGA